MKRLNKKKGKPKNSQIKQEPGSDYTMMNTENSSSQGLTQGNILSSTSYHRTCEKLNYGKFIQVLTTGNLNLLRIKGKSTKEQLEEAWEDIKAEYSNLIQTPKSDTLFDVVKKLARVQWLMLFLDMALDTLKEQYDQGIANLICENGYPMIEDLEDREDYLKQIYRVEIEAKVLIVLSNQYYAEYQSLIPKDAADTIKKDILYYEKELAFLSRFQGSRIDKNKITVLEFCAIVNTFLEEAKKKNKNYGDTI